MQLSAHCHKGYDIGVVCKMWNDGQYGTLWQMALKPNSSTHTSKSHVMMQQKQNVSTVIAYARDGALSKACQALTDSGLAPDTPDIWNLLKLKNPEGPVPISSMYIIIIIIIIIIYNKITITNTTNNINKVKS